VVSDLNRQFLERVVVWPEPQGAGWINLHCHMKNRDPSKNDGKPWVIGWPFKKIDDFISRAKWVDQTDQFFDVWYCTSQQNQIGENRSGKPKAVRLHRNATWLKAIWIDIDAKDDGKHYPTTGEAWNAISAFRKKVGLPFPSALVDSGGGMHIYWISHVPLSPDEWRPYAEGLKQLMLAEGIVADTGLTTDDVRILRVPGTLNHKYDPPRPVELVHLGTDYNFVTDLAFLAKIAPASEPEEPSHGADIDPSFEGASPSSAFAALAPDASLQAGIGAPKSNTLLDPRPIFEQCGFMRHAIATGGKDYDNPLWNLSVLCTAFMENGNVFAHEISKGHASYTPADTQALYDRKVADRVDRDVGWPRCATIHGAGCKACQTCPHFSKGKSPLHLTGPVTATVSPGPTISSRWTDPLDFSLVPAEEAVERINDAGFFVLLQNGDIYREEPDGSLMVQRPQGFATLFASRKASVDEEKASSAGSVWKNSPLRREYEQIGYWPGGHNVPAKTYNLWQGWGIQPAAGNLDIIAVHILTVIAAGDDKKAAFIFDWCAHMVQRPLEKPGVALVLRGKKGTGKTILTQLIARCIGARNALVTADGKRLLGQFNWHLADKLLIVAEEAFFVGNRELNDRLKHLLTGEDFEAEQKFGQRVSMKSMHRVIMASNHDQVVAATDDERRFVVCDVSDHKRGDDAYFAPLIKIIRGQDDATLAAFMHHLLTRDISNFKPERAARAVGKRDLARQKLLSLEPPLQWLLEVNADLPPAGSFPKSISQTSTRELLRADMLERYRMWVRTAQVRGAGDYTGAEVFWNCLRRLLNNDIFPGRRLFRTSGGQRLVCLPPAQDLRDGFDRLLGDKVIV
jgi:hypothetical protein